MGERHLAESCCICRGDLEPAEASLPAAQRARAFGEEPRREGGADDGEAELLALRHDHTPAGGPSLKGKAGAPGTGGRLGPLGQ